MVEERLGESKVVCRAFVVLTCRAGVPVWDAVDLTSLRVDKDEIAAVGLRAHVCLDDVVLCPSTVAVKIENHWIRSCTVVGIRNVTDVRALQVIVLNGDCF